MADIVIHPGRCHIDEILACGLIMAHHPEEAFRILRREPAAGELDAPSTWVVGCGKRHEPWLHNFDHHQDRSLPAAFRLVAQHLEIDHLAKDSFPWWEHVGQCDTSLNDAFNSVRPDGKTNFETADHFSLWLVKIIGCFEEVPAVFVRAIAGVGKILVQRLAKASARPEESGGSACVTPDTARPEEHGGASRAPSPNGRAK